MTCTHIFIELNLVQLCTPQVLVTHCIPVYLLAVVPEVAYSLMSLFFSLQLSLFAQALLLAVLPNRLQSLL